MLKLGDEVTIVSSASYSGDDWSTHMGKTTMVTRITKRKDGAFMYGLKDVTNGAAMWSENDLQPTGRKLFESAIGTIPAESGEIVIIDIDGISQKRRVYSVYGVYNQFNTLVDVEYALWNYPETIPYAYIRRRDEVKPVNTYTLF